jgi:uncharacterized protein (TIGR02145 family)
MVRYFRLPVLLLIVLSLLLLTTCEELEREMLVVTNEVFNVSVTSADAGGQVIDIGQGATQHGHCYSKEPNVTVSDPHTRLGTPTGTGGFTSPLSDLEPGTLYYVKAYISNGDITVYGSEISFTTYDISPAILTTSEVGSVTETTAVSGGNITSDGSSEVTVRGVVWGISENPTLEDNEGFTEDGTGTGEFTSNLIGLKAGTTYYVKAYATNGAGTAYGNQQNFTTIEETVVTDIDGNQYQVIVIGQQRWLSSNLKVSRYRDGDLVATGLTDPAWQDASQGASAVYPHALVAGINSQSDMVEAYGRLYNWLAVTDSRGLCPAGWRVPTDEDWDELSGYIGDADYPEDVIGNALKSCRQVESPHPGDCATTVHPRWNNSVNYGTDDFGFAAFPGGLRYSNGEYLGLGEIGSWWSSTSLGDDNAWQRSIYHNSGIIDKSADIRQMGLSVRCIK